MFRLREELTPETQSVLILIGSIAAGCLGALTGLGGGVVVVVLLVLGFGVEMRLAVGASLVAVIATSCSSSASFLRGGYVNLRVGTVLELATALGAVLGAVVSPWLPVRTISLLFCAVLFWSAWQAIRQRTEHESSPDGRRDPLAERLGLDGTVPSKTGVVCYRVERVAAGLVVMLGAGVLSALVGVGGGVVKVLAMDRLMRMPFKASTTTSNLMIGVTAAASAGVYFGRGQIEPMLAAPVALGAIIGAAMGSKLLVIVPVRAVRLVFAMLVIGSGVQLLVRTLMGGVG